MMRERCSICLRENFTTKLSDKQNAEGIFHNEHIYLAAGDFISSWQLIQSLTTIVSDSAGNRLFQSSVFTRAVLIRQRGLTSLGISEFRRYLNLQPQDTLLKAEAFLALTNLYLKKHDLLSSTEYSGKALDLSFFTNSASFQRRLYQSLSTLEEHKRNFELALEYRNLAETFIDSFTKRPPDVIQQAEPGWRLAEDINSQKKSFRGNQRYIVPIIISLLLVLLLRAKIRGSSKVRALTQTAETLRQANESKDQLFAIISHDLRSYLYSFQLNVSKFRNGLYRLSKEELAAIGDMVSRLITSMQSLLNNLLYWSLGKTGQLNHHPETVRIEPILEQVCFDYVTIAASANLKLVKEIFKDVRCTADVNSLKLMLRNVIDNAIKYTPAEGTVTISAYQQQQFCNITVRDTGIGIPGEKIEQILSGSTDRVQEDTQGRRSTGLGLVLVRDLAKKNNGQLNIISEKGSGTIVNIILPA